MEVKAQISEQPELLVITEMFDKQLHELKERQLFILQKLLSIHEVPEVTKAMENTKIPVENASRTFSSRMRGMLGELLDINNGLRLACEHLSKLTP